MNANRRRLSMLLATVGVTLIVAFLPGVALGSPNDTQYDNPSTSEPTNVDKGGTGGTGDTGGTLGASAGSPPASTSGGTLPFTGQELVLFAGLGGLFILTGLGLRVAARARNQS
jgi:hypothetical protein